MRYLPLLLLSLMLSACETEVITVREEDSTPDVVYITLEDNTPDIEYTTETVTIIQEDTTPDVVYVYEYPSGPVPALMLEEDGSPAMADGPLSGLTAATALADADLMLITQGGTSKKITADLLRDYLNQNPRLGFFEHEDFIGDNLLPGWTDNSSGTGAQVNRVAVQGRPGVHDFNTGTTATGQAVITKWNGGALWPAIGELECSVGVYVPILGTAPENFSAWIGLTDQTSGSIDPSNAYCFKYNPTAGPYPGNWALMARNGGAETQADSGITVAATTWYDLQIKVNAAGTSAEYFINGVSVGTIATNLPAATNPIAPNVRMRKTAGTTARSLYVDYFQTRQTFTAAR